MYSCAQVWVCTQTPIDIHTNHCTYVKVRRQLLKFCSLFPPCGVWRSNGVVRLGSKHLHHWPQFWEIEYFLLTAFKGIRSQLTAHCRQNQPVQVLPSDIFSRVNGYSFHLRTPGMPGYLRPSVIYNDYKSCIWPLWQLKVWKPARLPNSGLLPTINCGQLFTFVRFPTMWSFLPCIVQKGFCSVR